MFWSGLKKKNGKRSYKDLKSHVLVGKEPLCAFMNRDHLLADKEDIYLEDLIPYTLLFPRGNAITKKNVLKNAKEKAGIELRLEEIPYSLILQDVYKRQALKVTTLISRKMTIHFIFTVR